MDKNFITVVFEYNQGTKLLKDLTNAFASPCRTYVDAKISAVSLGDEITRCEQLEEKLQNRLN